jgi:hypothetical protein
VAFQSNPFREFLRLPMQALTTMFWKTFLLCTVLTFALPALADDKTTAADVGKKLDETGETVRKFTVGQRDEALRSAKAGLDDLDARIGRLEADLARKWDKMDKLAREQARATLDALHRQRNDLAEWYGGLKHG